MTTGNLKGRTGASDENRPTQAPAGRAGRPEAETEGADAFVYGEPKGPRPPHFTILPKDVIETPPASRDAADMPPTERYETDEQPIRGYYGGLSTPETFQTTGDQQPKIVRRDLETFRDEPDEEASHEDGRQSDASGP